jgi:hypothetical protein
MLRCDARHIAKNGDDWAKTSRNDAAQHAFA